MYQNNTMRMTLIIYNGNIMHARVDEFAGVQISPHDNLLCTVNGYTEL